MESSIFSIISKKSRFPFRLLRKGRHPQDIAGMASNVASAVVVL